MNPDMLLLLNKADLNINKILEKGCTKDKEEVISYMENKAKLFQDSIDGKNPPGCP